MGKKNKNKKKAKGQKTQTSSAVEAATVVTSTSTPHGENNTCISTKLSLPSRLKRERGTAATTPLPPVWKDPDRGTSSSRSTSKNVLTPSDGHRFDSCLRQCYRGLSWEEPATLPQSLHRSFLSSFQELNEAGLFLYDVIQPGGKRLSLTMVTRTLIGQPGSTYRYLGLRLFSHPWCDVDEDGNRLTREKQQGEENGTSRGSTLRRLGYGRTCVSGLLAMGDINEDLIDRTRTRLDEDIAPHIPNGLVGSAEYNLTLINKMEPTSAKRDLKTENIYGMGKTSVSWHKDSGLQDFSSIAVYHTLQDYDRCSDNGADESKTTSGNATSSSSSKDEPWRVAVRVASVEAQTPALSIPLPSGALYYLLDDFNHQHEHAVISGTEKLRYSSTHRVAREGQGTWQYIHNKVDVATKKIDAFRTNLSSLESLSIGRRKQLIKECRAQQMLLSEIEFEWLRQWYVQGKSHAELHPYWHRPVDKLESVFRNLENLTVNIIDYLKKTAKGDKWSAVRVAFAEDLFDILIEAIEERAKERAKWHERYQDPIFSSLPEGMKPLICPVLDRKETNATCELSEDLTKLGSKLRRYRSSAMTAVGDEGTTGGSAKTAAVAVDSTKKRKRSSSSSKKGKDKATRTNVGGLTKKEQKRKASNWEKMKMKLGK